MKNMNSSKGAKTVGMVGGIRTPMAGSGVYGYVKPKLSPSTAANTTMPGIAKQSAPIRSPQNGGKIVRMGK